ASAQEFDFAQIDPTANTGGTMGVVVDNNLTDTTTLNQILRTNSATFHPHQAVADYQETQPGGITVTQQIIPVSGTVPAGGSGAAPLVGPDVGPGEDRRVAGSAGAGARAARKEGGLGWHSRRTSSRSAARWTAPSPPA